MSPDGGARRILWGSSSVNRRDCSASRYARQRPAQRLQRQDEARAPGPQRQRLRFDFLRVPRARLRRVGDETTRVRTPIR